MNLYKIPYNVDIFNNSEIVKMECLVNFNFGWDLMIELLVLAFGIN